MSLSNVARSPVPEPGQIGPEEGFRARHGDPADVIGRWRTASLLVRRLESFRRDVRYGDGDGETLDIYPTPRANAPVLVFIHGGHGRSLGKADHAFVAPSFTAAGALVIVPDYARCQVVGIEHIALRMTRAIAWIHRHAAIYGGDPRRIVVAGHSAGAHLAAMMLCCRWKDVDAALPAQLVGGALSISGVFDLAPMRGAPFLQSDLPLTAATLRRLSPAGFPCPRTPLYAAVGSDDSAEFRRQTALIRDRWGPTGVPVCETIQGAGHDTVMHGLADPQGRLHRMGLRLLGLA